MARPRKVPTTDPKAKPDVRGKRLKSLRQMAGFTREKFANNYAIPAGTLQGWECGRFGGLTESGAKRFIKAIREAGIQCSQDWLLFGIGPAPRPTEKLYLDDETVSASKIVEGIYEPNIVAELEVFRHHYPDAAYTIVKDAMMLPRFVERECVAGIRRVGDTIATASGFDCIVELQNGNTLVRQVQVAQESEQINLVATAQSSANSVVSLGDVISVAPIIWQRRMDTKK